MFVMKFAHRTFIYPLMSFGVAIVLSLTSCDKGFEEMNRNPNAYTDPVLNNLFSNVVITGYDQRSIDKSKNQGCYVQYFASLNPGQWPADKYVYKQNYNDGLWEEKYSIPLKLVTQILSLTKDNPELVNQYNIARIMRVEVMHFITDMYGDVPYFEAGLGFLDRVYKPKYDRQSDIYADMLKELDEAAQALDPEKPSYGAADFLYSGDPAKWRTFAYSLMLRYGMRLTKVNPGMAETWVKKAIAGGVIQSIEAMPVLKHTSASETNWNAESKTLQGAEGPNPAAKGKGYCKLNKAFIDHMLATNDPRLRFYSTLWEGNINIADLPEASEPSIQKGLPGGYDHSTIRQLYPDWTDNDQQKFSEPNLNTVVHLDAPTIYQTYSEVEYLLAEAALRGWGPGTPSEHYSKGVIASLQSQSLYPNGMNVDDATTAANNYLAENPYMGGDFETQMEQIHTQYWVSMFMNNFEAYSNWRRTGYPTLTPTQYAGNQTGGVIPRRMLYPVSEQSLNTENYNAVLQVQGADTYLTRVWWDKE
jgi:hypothetical protein